MKDPVCKMEVNERTQFKSSHNGRAIMDALKNNPRKIAGSRIYFIRLDIDGKMAKSGKPYCTICSKMSLDAGIGEFVLLHEEGICVYEAEEYNTLSYDYQSKNTTESQ